MTRFETLDVWKKAAALCCEIYADFRNLKDFAYKDQITRSGLSVVSNIAEGFERGSQKEIGNFLNYSKGSAGELRSQIYIGMKIGYIDREKGNKWIKESEEISKMLFSLMKTVKENPEPGQIKNQ